jgi:hypothetical protein
VKSFFLTNREVATRSPSVASSSKAFYEKLAPWVWCVTFQGRLHGLSRTQGSVFYRLLVYSAVDLVLMVQVVRGWRSALFAAWAVGEEEIREYYSKNEADDSSAASSNGNKASEQGTQRDECQTNDHSEVFHETRFLSSQERVNADQFASCD